MSTSKPRKRYRLPILKIRFKKSEITGSEPLDYPGIAYKISSGLDKTEIAIHLFSPCNKIITKNWLLNKDLISCTVKGGEEEVNNIDSVLKTVYKTEEEVEKMRGKLQYLVVDEKDLKKLSSIICDQSTTLGQKARKGHIEFICDELQ